MFLNTEIVDLDQTYKKRMSRIKMKYSSFLMTFKPVKNFADVVAEAVAMKKGEKPKPGKFIIMPEKEEMHRIIFKASEN